MGVQNIRNDPAPAQRADVLIIGAGPAGCMAAATLARYGVGFRIFDKRPVRTQAGHASGFQPRTQEILQTMNSLRTLDERGHRFTETAFWGPDEHGKLSRTSVGREVVDATPIPYMFNTDQGQIEAVFERDIESRGHRIGRFHELIDYSYDERRHGGGEWPLLAHVKNHVSGAIERWQAKYIVGTDGARSATRRIAGIGLQSFDGEHVWCVTEVLLKTDFPDYRRRCAIRTPRGGCMLIPRKDEGLRVFMQLEPADAEHLQGLAAQKEKGKGGLAEDESFQLLSMLQRRVRDILHPYRLDITEVLWISRYTVTQRLVSRFSDERQRVFLVGDACHTHSPKAAQGMNVSVSDAYNLTWKLALVLRGLAWPSLLATYEHERLPIARQLIDFDRRFAVLFGQKLDGRRVENHSSPELRDVWQQSHGFTSGLDHRYAAGLLVDANTRGAAVDPTALEPLVPGKRLYDMALERHVDGNATALLDDMTSNGRFHLFIFAGALLFSPRIAGLARYLASRESPLYIGGGGEGAIAGPFHHKDVTSAIPAPNRRFAVDLFLVHTLPRADVELRDLPEPFASQWPTRVYEDVGGKGHAEHGVREDCGTLALVRPDGYVGMVAELTRCEDVTSFLKNIFY